MIGAGQLFVVGGRILLSMGTSATPPLISLPARPVFALDPSDLEPTDVEERVAPYAAHLASLRNSLGDQTDCVLRPDATARRFAWEARQGR